MKYDNKVIWMFDKHPYYIATIQDRDGKLLAIELEETDYEEDRAKHTTDD